MSRARNLAGFVTAISPVVNLQVGVISATKFVGPFDVEIGYASTSGIATVAQGLTGTPDIAVRNVTGVAATFTDDVSVSDNTNSVKLKENGTATFISGTTAVLKIKDAANSGVNKITLKKDGSGEYHGDIQVGGDANNGAEAGVGIGSIGRIDVARAAASPIIRGYRTDSSARTVLNYLIWKCRIYW